MLANIWSSRNYQTLLTEVYTGKTTLENQKFLFNLNKSKPRNWSLLQPFYFCLSLPFVTVIPTKTSGKGLPKEEPCLNWKNTVKTIWECSHTKKPNPRIKEIWRNFLAGVITAGRVKKSVISGRNGSPEKDTPKLNKNELICGEQGQRASYLRQLTTG